MASVKVIYCPFFLQICHPQLTIKSLVFVLFCVLPVCYDVRLSHLNKDYLLTCFLTAVAGMHANTSDLT